MLLTPPAPATIPDLGSASTTPGARLAAVDVPAVGVGDDARMISTPAPPPTTAATSTATTTTTRLLPRPRWLGVLAGAAAPSTRTGTPHSSLPDRTPSGRPARSG